MAAQPRRILVGYDGSDGANKALDTAARLIGYGSTLAIASVASEGPYADAMLSQARERLLERQLTALYLPLYGDPGTELADVARALEADLVVVGRRSENGIPNARLGRVSEDVVRRAPCDVLVVK